VRHAPSAMGCRNALAVALWLFCCADAQLDEGYREQPLPLPALPLHTQGRYIVDANGRRTRLHCVNWYGAHLKQMTANGLNRRSASEISQAILDAGFNCVRLPFSLDNVLGNFSHVPKPQVSLAACPDLQDMSPLEIFDATLRALTDKGLMVILNNHVSKSEWCCSLSDHEGLWYTPDYPESSWIDSLRMMAARYRENPLVVGFDLRNEIRPSGFLWPDWNTKNNQTDWAAASVRGAEAVLEENENMLIIVSGTYFSNFLCQVPSRPIHSEVPSLAGRIVYTAHEYKWFNFRIMTRKIIEIYMLVLALTALALLAGWLCLQCARERMWRILQLLCLRCPARCCTSFWSAGRSHSGLEFTFAALLTALGAVCLKVFPHMIQTCDFNGFLVATWCALLFPTCAALSLLLWIRAGFVLLMQCLEPGELPKSQLEASLPDLPISQMVATCQRPGCARRVCSKQAKRCRSLPCLFATVLGVVFLGLGIVWKELGTYAAFERELDFKWGFMMSATAAEPAPVWLGEFGTNSESLWWRHILTYLERHDVDFAYWSVNGEKYNGKPETFGLFMPDFAEVRHPWKLQQLQGVMNRLRYSLDHV